MDLRSYLPTQNIVFFCCLTLFLIFSCGRIFDEVEATELNEMGLELYNLGEYEEAREHFQEALTYPNLSPDTRSSILRNIGQTFFETDEIDSSTYYYTIAAQCFEPGTYAYLVNMADVNINDGKTSLALEQLLDAYTLESEDLNVNNLLGLIYLGDFGEEFFNPGKALSHNRLAHEINHDRLTEEVLARNYEALGQYSKAIRHYRHIIDTYPEFPDYQLSIGYCYLHNGNIKKADQHFAAAIAADSSYISLVDSYKYEFME